MGEFPPLPQTHTMSLPLRIMFIPFINPHPLEWGIYLNCLFDMIRPNIVIAPNKVIAHILYSNTDIFVHIKDISHRRQICPF